MNSDTLTIIGIILSVILIPISVHLSWYYNRLKKLKIHIIIFLN